MAERVLNHGPLVPDPAARRWVDEIPRIRPRSAKEPATPQAPSDWRALAVVTALAMVLGFAQGARVSLPEDIPRSALAHGTSDTTGTLETISAARTLWRPVGSTATAPREDLTPDVWRPAGSDFHGVHEPAP